jgi:hypothetical protein
MSSPHTHVFTCLLFSTTKFSKGRPRVLGLSCTSVPFIQQFVEIFHGLKFKQETNKNQDGFKNVIFPCIK